MLTYWLLFSYFALGAIFFDRSRAGSGQSGPLLAIGAIIIALLIGFRFEVGGDWGAYERMFAFARYADLGRMLSFGDPAYQLLNWTVQKAGGELWLVNLACGAIFSWGLYKLAKLQPNPWLAMVIAIPYLVIVVAMGYSRQSVAIGVLMAGLASLQRNASMLRYAGFIFLAALFHKTASVALPLGALTGRGRTLINVLIVIAGGYLLYDLLLEDSVGFLVRNYVDVKYSSEGAAIRVTMGVIPASIFFIFRKRLEFSPFELLLWRNFSLAALGLLILLFLLPSSTAVDRLALYVLPLQLVILSRVPGVLVSHGLGRAIIITYSFLVQFVWLNYATHAAAWVPYKFFSV